MSAPWRPRGRKPKPTALKVLEGNPGKRPLNGHEPIPPKGELKCPSWLLPEAKKEWKRLASSLEAMGVLTMADLTAFAGYCQAYARWKEAEEFITQHGSIFKTPSGYVQQVPQVSIAQQNLKIMQSFCSDFGLTPATRARIIANGGGGTEDGLGRPHGKAAQREAGRMIDERKARRVIDFIQCLRHTKGEFHGKPLQACCRGRRRSSGTCSAPCARTTPPCASTPRRTSKYPRSKGKSELGAAIALNMLVNDGEWKAEVYSCASDRQQAAIVFDVAVDMVKQSPALMKRIKIIPSMKRMVYQPTGSIYQVLSSEVATKHGLNVSACIFDELHTQPTRALYDVMTQGSGDARKQPLWFFLTTAGTDRNSICWEVHQKALDIIEGRKIDPRFYPVIFGLPDDADWTSEENWHRANPSLGHTITIDKVRDAFRKAQETPADENQFRQLRLNQWVKQSIRWMPMDKWDECGGVVDPYALEGRACYAGLDLSSTSDLTALALVFPPASEDEPYMALPFFWLPEETLALRVRRDHVPYDQWAKRGFIQTTEGNVVHYGFIERFICELGERYNIREIAHDRWNATMMVQTLEDDGFTMVPFGQGFRDMSPPTKELMRLVLEHKLCHGGHPVLRWNMDNAYVRTDPAGNLKLDKEKSTEKVDGAVALVMALDRAMKNLNGGDSVYNHRGFLVL